MKIKVTRITSWTNVLNHIKNTWNKILILCVTFLFVSCVRPTDPLRYKGCIVINKDNNASLYNIQLKLTPYLRDSIGRDYIWILVPNYEKDRLNIGDTIK